MAFEVFTELILHHKSNQPMKIDARYMADAVRDCAMYRQSAFLCITVS